jgi:phospholipid/cholesterol/gamma-HCH transport system substrate-binding protein
MDGRNTYLVVGIFVSAGIVALIALTLFFSGGRSTEPTTRYTVMFERDISGLSLGAPVRYLGVDVGQVIAMYLVSDIGTKVRVDLEVRQSTPVTTASYAGLTFQGVTGVAFIGLAADNAVDARPLLSKNGEYPQIPAKNTGLAALLADGPAITGQLSELLLRANALLDTDNRESLGRTLANLDKLTQALASEQGTIAGLPQQLQSVLQQVEVTVGDLQETLRQAQPDFLASMQRLNETTDNLAAISARMDSWMSDHDDEMQQFIDGGLGKMPALIADTRNTIRDLEKLLNELRENPSQIIYKPQSDAVEVEH